MKNLFNVFRIIIACILLVVLTFNIAVVILSGVIGINLTHIRFYDRVLQQESVYAQLRQVFFKILNLYFPRSSEGMEYIKQAVTTEFIRDKVVTIGDDILEFIKGNSNETPIIPVKDFNKALLDKVGDQSMIDYWLGFTDNDVKLSDVMSVNLMYDIRVALENIKFYLLGTIVSVFVLLILITLAVWSIKDGIVMFGGALMSGGLLTCIVSVAIRLILPYINSFNILLRRVSSSGLGAKAAQDTLLGITELISNNIILIGLVIALIGLVIISIVPVKHTLHLVEE